MAINGLITDIGLTQSQIALNNQGWFIFPTRFEVADTAGVFSKTRVGARIWEAATSYAVGDLVVPTTPGFGFYFIVSVAGTSGGSEPDWPTSSGSVTDGGVTWDFVGATTGGLEAIWFAATISTRIEAPPNTLEIVLTIPPGADPSNRDIEEIYIFAEDQLGVEFLLGIGQPDATITYDKDGTTSLRLAITLTNVNISGLFIFKYTQATEIAEHSTDPNAHPDIRDLLQLQFNLASNGDMALDRNPSGFALGAKTFGYGPAEWEGQLTATGAVSGTLIRKTDSVIEGSRSMHFSAISLTGGGEELHIRKRIRGDTARLFSNTPWSASVNYVVGEVVVPTSSPLLRFRVTVAGTSDSAEPTWPTLAGDTIVDGTVTWEAILGNFSMSWRVFQDTGVTQFAIITLRTPDALDDFGGSSTLLLVTGATDHPMLDDVVSTVERAAITLPNVNNGLEIDIQVDTGVLSSKNFQFSRFKFEPTEKITPFTSFPFELDYFVGNPHLTDILNYEVVIGLQADVDKGIATVVINDLGSLSLAAGDRILVMEGTHTLTAPISLSENNLVIRGVSPLAIIDQASTHIFTLSGDGCIINGVSFSNTLTNGVVLSGTGSRLVAFNVPLSDISVSNNSWAISGDGLKGTGYIIPASGNVTFADIQATGDVTVDKTLIGLEGISYDIIVGSSAQVTSGVANYTISTFIAAMASDYRVLFLNGNHTLTGSIDIGAGSTLNDIHLYFQPEARITKASTYTVTLSAARSFMFGARFVGFTTDDIEISGTSCLVMAHEGAFVIFDVSGNTSLVMSEGGIKATNWDEPSSGKGFDQCSVLLDGSDMAGAVNVSVTPTYTALSVGFPTDDFTEIDIDTLVWVINRFGSDRRGEMIWTANGVELPVDQYTEVDVTGDLKVRIRGDWTVLEYLFEGRRR